MKKIIALGLMSGTSADGLSIAAVNISKKGKAMPGSRLWWDKAIKVFKYKTYAYDAKLRKKILSAPEMNAFNISELNFELGLLWSTYVVKFCKTANLKYKDISVIGSHGQTVCHSPLATIPNTLQIGEASFIAKETGIPVVCDFRPMDMASGGQGAPLIPFLDEFMFGTAKSKLLLNIGGIANFSMVGKGLKTFACDIGPGNCLMDSLIEYITKGKMQFDKDGVLALKGKIDYKKIEKMLKESFFSMKPPKSADRNDFSLKFIKKYFRNINLRNSADVIATLNYLTAKSIEVSIKKYIRSIPLEMIVSGGGVFNGALMKNLRALLKPMEVSSIADYSMHPLAKEPACFALLAWEALNGRTNHPCSATGAKNKKILGKIIR
ncbi:MAG: anhydro-N-acetylmuramic acid kinase [Elusimicrobia bacterium]|nr:anhydro-N-acetylmuramic acid kinase [Elusimicrobiota bacterium]